MRSREQIADWRLSVLDPVKRRQSRQIVPGVGVEPEGREDRGEQVLLVDRLPDDVDAPTRRCALPARGAWWR